MSKAQLVITAVVLEGRSISDVARDYDISRQWVYTPWSNATKLRAPRRSKRARVTSLRCPCHRR